jgi:hypothetical protein
MKILYGSSIYNSIDVTNICLSQLTKNNIIRIPNGDHNRANIFTDPLPGIIKKIFILNDDNIREYDISLKVHINTLQTTQQIIEKIHSKLNIKHGNLSDELPEQKMSVRYLKGNEKVLEIGGNIGRNSLF